METAGHIKPRILALDLDETLLRSNLTVTTRTKAAIKRTGELGVTIVLASGRVQSSVEPYSKLLELHKRPAYLISNYGALIQESNTDKIVHEALLDSKTILAICDLAEGKNFPLTMYSGNIMYVSKNNEYTSLEQSLTGVRQVVVENFRAMVGEGCYKLIIPGDPKLLEPLKKTIHSTFGEQLSLSYSRPYYLELMPQGTDKGSALVKIAKILGVSAAETMAVGDSMNDETMIRWAGIGVAIANADERLKKAADLVTEHDNNEDGVAELIEKYFF